jgi:hypothetical protein
VLAKNTTALRKNTLDGFSLVAARMCALHLFPSDFSDVDSNLSDVKSVVLVAHYSQRDYFEGNNECASRREST